MHTVAVVFYVLMTFLSLAMFYFGPTHNRLKATNVVLALAELRGWKIVNDATNLVANSVSDSPIRSTIRTHLHVDGHGNT